MDSIKTHVDALLARLHSVDAASLVDASLARPAAVALAAVVGVVALLAAAARASTSGVRPTVRATTRSGSGETARRSSR